MDTYKLESGDEMSIAPSFGCNVFSWKLNGKEVFYTPAGFTEKMQHFYQGGNPILFPSVGRTWDCSGYEPVQGLYSIFGESAKHNMPIHGILTLTEWTKSECAEESGSVHAAYRLMVPDIVKELSYPFDLEMVIVFHLAAGSLEMDTRIFNAGRRAAPFAFGFHPYFALSNSERNGIYLDLPSSTKLVLEPELLVPTGDTEPTPSHFTLELGIDYDCVYGKLTGNRATLNDTDAGRRIHIDFDDNIENLVIYAGSKNAAVCIEPWTRGLGAYSQLSDRDWENSAAINVLQPGEERNIKVRYSVE